MANTSVNTKIIILAAGKGKRMQNDALPKVLSLLKGRPLIHHLLHRIEQSELDPSPILVVGYHADQVRQACGLKYLYAEQKEQLGTGHAVQQALPLLNDQTNTIMVLNGDHPLTGPLTLKKLHLMHTEQSADVSLITTVVSDFINWQKPFYDFGRIIRDNTGRILSIIEKKDASEAELALREINVGMYCFNYQWLKKHIDRLQNNNAQKEYYITDLIKIAITDGAKIVSLTTDPMQALGVNTAEHLALAEKLIA